MGSAASAMPGREARRPEHAPASPRCNMRKRATGEIMRHRTIRHNLRWRRATFSPAIVSQYETFSGI
jgi:hypothetical protein